MNKADLISQLESRLGGRRAAAEALDAVLDVIVRSVAAGEKVGITGFGTFEKAERAARTGRNPRTGESVPIKKTAVPRFKAGTSFRTFVADPKQLPGTASTMTRAAATTSTAGRAARTGAVKKSAPDPVVPDASDLEPELLPEGTPAAAPIEDDAKASSAKSGSKGEKKAKGKKGGKKKK